MTAGVAPPNDSPLRDLVVAASLLILTNGPILFVSNRVLHQTPSWEDAFVRPVLVLTALAGVALVVLDPVRVAGRRLTPPPRLAAGAVVVFTVWAVLSSLWSVDPGITRGRALLYVGLAALAWVIADLDLQRARRAVLAMGIAGVAASVVLVVVSDSIGIDSNNDWRGIYTNRNSLAPVAAITVIAGLGAAVESRGRRRGAGVAVVLVGGGALLQTGSRTAMLALAVALGLATLLLMARTARDRFGRRGLVASFGAGTLGLAALVVVVWNLWDESTFTQRRTIWKLVWEKGRERAFQGHGWFAIWGDPEFTSGHRLLGRGSAHGSFFEVWLGLGVVGVVAFLVIVALALGGAVRNVWRDPSVGNWVWMALVGFLVTENLTESFVLWFSYNWVLLMAAALRTSVGLRREHGERMPLPSAVASG